MSNWWQAFFDDEYAAYGLASTKPEVIAKMCDFIVSTLQLSPGMTLFDQCCGIGRLSVPLAERGIRIIGVDQSAAYIDRARREAQARRLPCEFHVGDAFEFVCAKPCDAAINWFTSFGYCEDDSQNIRMFQRIAESLKPGGRFVMDYLNLPRVFGEFRQWFIDRPTDDGLKGMMVLHETSPDFPRGMMNSQWTFLHPDGRRSERQIATRMYMPHDITGMLSRCGFGDTRLFGWIDGEEFTRQSKRLIVAARRM